MLSLSESEFKQLAEYIKVNYGINLLHKKSLIEGRLGNMLVERGFDSFSTYLQHVFSDVTKAEMTNLINKLTTNHTFFMREANHFEYFRNLVLPYLRATVKDRDLRIWSAGCSSGEEAFTLAMILADYFGLDEMFWDKKVLATDISVKVLEKAERGVYSAESMHNIPPNWRVNYFRKIDDENYQVEEQLKREVIFRVLNLMDDVFPFRKKFHVIFCRNVMIYFDEATKMKLIQKFYDATEPGGFLFIGHSESINRNETNYRYVMPAIYRKE